MKHLPLILAVAALALAVTSLVRSPTSPATPATTPSSVAACPCDTAPLEARITALQARVETLRSKLERATGNRPGPLGVDAPPPPPPPDAAAPPPPLKPRYKRVTSPHAAVEVSADADGALQVVNTDPKLAGKIMMIEMEREDGTVEEVPITVPAPQ